jgi:hypothetical protein
MERGFSSGNGTSRSTLIGTLRTLNGQARSTPQLSSGPSGPLRSRGMDHGPLGVLAARQRIAPRRRRRPGGPMMETESTSESGGSSGGRWSLPAGGSDGPWTARGEGAEGGLHRRRSLASAEAVGEQSARLRRVFPEGSRASSEDPDHWSEGMPPGWFALAAGKNTEATRSPEVIRSHTPDW